jgi:hypothetical protein
VKIWDRAPLLDCHTTFGVMMERSLRPTGKHRQTCPRVRWLHCFDKASGGSGASVCPARCPCTRGSERHGFSEVLRQAER